MLSMSDIFYFHGFASTGSSWKIRLLIDHLEKSPVTGKKISVTAPTLPSDPVEVVRVFDKFIAGNGKPGLVIGSSLGGFYARYVSARSDIPAVLINPSIFPWFTLAGSIGVHERFYSGEKFEWKKEYLDSLKKMNGDIEKYGAKHHRLHFFLAADDELLDHKKIPELFPDAGSIRFFEDCAHSFNRFPEILPEIEKFFIS